MLLADPPPDKIPATDDPLNTRIIRVPSFTLPASFPAICALGGFACSIISLFIVLCVASVFLLHLARLATSPSERQEFRASQPFLGDL